MLTRRFVMFGSVALCASPAMAGGLGDIEARSGGRLGVAVLDTQTGRTLQHRADERFAMCSTFKLVLAAAVLARVDAGKDKLDRAIRYGKADLVTYSPVTEKHVAEGALTLKALCKAALEVSDNTAANLLLGTIGGPAGWTSFARSLGDDVSRLDRMEIELNTAIAGDPRDTTTPAAMLKTMQKILLGDALSEASRRFVIDTLSRSTVGARRLRAGLPPDWRIADKTGSGLNGTRNDIAVIWPPQRAPILACVYLTQSKLTNTESEEVIAEVGRAIAAM